MKNNKIVTIIIVLTIIATVTLATSINSYASTGTDEGVGVPMPTSSPSVPLWISTPPIRTGLSIISDRITGLVISYPMDWEYGSATINSDDHLSGRSITIFSPNGYKLRFIRLIWTGKPDWILVVGKKDAITNDKSNPNNPTQKDSPAVGSIYYLSPGGVGATLISGTGFHSAWTDKEIVQAQDIIDNIMFATPTSYSVMPTTATALPPAPNGQ
jgi:hypothetical protein